MFCSTPYNAAWYGADIRSEIASYGVTEVTQYKSPRCPRFTRRRNRTWAVSFLPGARSRLWQKMGLTEHNIHVATITSCRSARSHLYPSSKWCLVKATREFMARANNMSCKTGKRARQRLSHYLLVLVYFDQLDRPSPTHQNHLLFKDSYSRGSTAVHSCSRWFSKW